MDCYRNDLLLNLEETKAVGLHFSKSITVIADFFFKNDEKEA